VMEKEEIMKSVSAHCLSAVWPLSRFAAFLVRLTGGDVVDGGECAGGITVVWAVLVTAVTEVVGGSQAGDRWRRLGAFSGIRPCRRQQLRRLLPARATAAGYVYFLVPGIKV
jgi:hypothetical protein